MMLWAARFLLAWIALSFVMGAVWIGAIAAGRHARARRFDRHVASALDVLADEQVGWCADCAEPVAGIAAHYRAAHPRVAAIPCLPCNRAVPADCWEAHRSLFHQPRYAAVEDLQGWTA